MTDRILRQSPVACVVSAPQEGRWPKPRWQSSQIVVRAATPPRIAPRCARCEGLIASVRSPRHQEDQDSAAGPAWSSEPVQVCNSAAEVIWQRAISLSLCLLTAVNCRYKIMISPCRSAPPGHGGGTNTL